MLLLFVQASGATHAAECVILLHGLARSSSSMEVLAGRLGEAGYSVANIDYPSRKHPILELAEMAVGEGLRQCQATEPERIHMVTHSLGGILMRVYAQLHPDHPIARVVMLGPPNQGSEAVDNLKDVPGYEGVISADCETPDDQLRPPRGEIPRITPFAIGFAQARSNARSGMGRSLFVWRHRARRAADWRVIAFSDGG